MSELATLLENNRAWARRMCERDPAFFLKLARQQAPQYLWIGCADSRLPANDILGLGPGELFVHRNVANLVLSDDVNCMTVLRFAVETLGVRHVMVCGHYGCGGVLAAMSGEPAGALDDWLCHIREVQTRHGDTLDALSDAQARADRLCELNVAEQVCNVARTDIVGNAWARHQPVTVHGLIYGLETGLLSELGMSLSAPDDLRAARPAACRPQSMTS